MSTRLLELPSGCDSEADPAIALHMTKAIEDRPANEIRSVGRYFCSETGRQAVVLGQGFLAGVSGFAGGQPVQPLLPRVRSGVRLSQGRDGRLSALSVSLSGRCSGLRRARDAACRAGWNEACRAARGECGRAEEELRRTEVYRGANCCARTALSAGHLDPRLPVDRQPQCVSPIEGLTPETHAAYCRDALAMILKECPEIQGLTMRVHGESGIPEGSYDFWKTLFEAIKGCGRTVEIDMHAKGVNQKMIDIAVATGMPVKLGAKYSAEHQSLGYQQADIRALEIPKPGHEGEGPFSLSSGARSFTRYGYADFLKTGSKYKVLFRLWPGTQRHLICADPEMAAAYGRTSHFCGAVGMDLMEPLTFKGREGSGQPGGRCAYADANAESQIRLAEIRTVLSRVGTKALRSGRGCRGVAAMAA